ncbi:PknH-like extracellular domain-containing protein [Actinacidiphila alni]|uniref:PknH-like extracellular domain-containing protein n=1 Tax=Actinacidiphila alni TaxID=380248 RepID=A0A1I2FWN7_9ACTN|nr:sensor domain-containing protein [Actinacidiphila alni]SFF09239.1 PknH-like extracellular domain-containing protein [Actinacidiphila alni]
MRKTRLRLAAAVVPAVLLAAACSGSSDDGKGGATDSASASASANGSDGSGGSDDAGSTDGTLSKAQLAKALITQADVPGWTVQVSQTDDSAGTATLTADKADCQPLADVTSSKPKIPRKAFIGAAFARTTSGATPDAINQMLVASHAPGDAQKVLASVKTALGTCTGFTATDNTGTKTPFTIAKGPQVPTGDEAVSYVMTDTKDKKSGAALVTVVRTGDTVTAYLSVKSAGGAGDLPIEVARKQNEKLKAAQK